MTDLYEVKTVEADGLIASGTPAVDAFFVTIAGLAAATTLKRGTVLALNGDGKMIVLGSGEGTANCVLCDDTAIGTEEVKAVAYRSGHFAVEKLAVADGYTMTATDKEALRAVGILLSNAIEL